MSIEDKYEDSMESILNVSYYITQLSLDKDLDKLNLFRILLNEKIMEAIKIRSKLYGYKK